MFLLCTVLPALTIVACYLGIAWKVHKAYQEIQNINRIPNAAKLEKKLTLVSYPSEGKGLQQPGACRELLLLVCRVLMTLCCVCLALVKGGDVVTVPPIL